MMPPDLKARSTCAKGSILAVYRSGTSGRICSTTLPVTVCTAGSTTPGFEQLASNNAVAGRIVIPE
jgi:hypothetical protein